MKKDIKYILLLGLAAGLFILMEIVTPKPINWAVTLASRDKNPFGAYLIDQRMGDLFGSKTKSNQTLYELSDSVYQNLFILTQHFSPDQEDTQSLLNRVDKGGHVMIIADGFSGSFADTLGISTADYLFEGNWVENLEQGDTAALSFSNPRLAGKDYYYQRNNTQYYFSRFDSSKTVILSTNDLGRPTLITLPWGKGQLLLGSTPLTFTNNYMVYADNYEYASHALSYLPGTSIHWTEYYQLGRNEAQTPLRYILTNEPLRWAYYTAILSLLLFILFEAKRKQRIIPIIEPLKNETLSFVGTISNLYYQNQAHRSIAIKKINFFIDRLHKQHFLNLREEHQDFISQIALKTGNDEVLTQSLFDLMAQIKAKSQISEAELFQLNNLMEKFKLN